MAEDYKLITRESYDAVAEGYAARDGEEVDESQDIYAALETFRKLLTPGAKILDVGCASGRDSLYFHKHGFKVTGIDYSPELIRIAKELDSRVDFRVMDFEKIDLKDAYDGIWANASLHHIPKNHLPAVLESLRRLLKPGGIIFIKVKCGSRDGLRTNMKFGVHLRRYFAYYQPEELSKLISAAELKVKAVETTTNNEWVDLLAQED